MSLFNMYYVSIPPLLKYTNYYNLLWLMFAIELISEFTIEFDRLSFEYPIDELVIYVEGLI